LHYLEFIRSGTLHIGVLKNPSIQASLIKSYVDKGTLLEDNYIENEVSIDALEALKKIFIV
jgi:hypothetical protein